MTRLEHARRKIGIARIAIGVGAATGLAVFGGLARTSHPATQHARTSNTSEARQSDDDSYGDDFYSGDDSDSYSNLGPAGSAAPQVQSGGS